MITHQALNARGENRTGVSVVDYLLETEAFKSDYYHGEEVTMMRWGGRGAEDLGLIGRGVNRQDMLALASGFHPDTKNALCQNAGEAPVKVTKSYRDGTAREVWQGGHRVGFDFTFTPGKDVSVLFALGDEQQRMEALSSHKTAVAKALEYLESVTETRRGQGGKDVIGVGGLVYSQHDHLANRNLEPSIHTHTLIYGVAQGSDGKWGTYDAKELYRHTRAADVIYQNELACNLREKGYAIEQRKERQSNGDVVKRCGVRGIEQGLCQAFSTRREEILAYHAEYGGSMQDAWAATRKHKDEPSHEELRETWREVAQSLGPQVADISRIKEIGRDIRLEASSRDALLEKLHESEAVVCQHDLVKLIGTEHMGFMRTEQIFAAVEDFKLELHKVQAKLLHNDDRGRTLAREYCEERYQSPQMRDTEQDIVQSALRRENERNLTLKSESTERAIADYQRLKGFTLSGEQVNAVRHMTNETAGVAILEGYAGTGKTTVSQVVKRAFENEGFTLIGVAISNSAAKTLQEESGMPCTSVARTLSMLDKGQMSLTSKHVVLVDEAGMLDVRNTESLMKYAERAGAKIILQGDENQLQPIMAGSGFMLAKAAIGSEKLKEIRRQEQVGMRAKALAFYDGPEDEGLKSRAQVIAKGKRIMENLEEHTIAHGTLESAQKHLVRSYLADPLPADQKLIVAHTREDVGSMTSMIRVRLKEQGQIGATDVSVRCRHGDGFEERAFAPGDRVRFRARDMSLGVVNGTEGSVREVRRNRRDGGVDFHIETEGRTLVFSSHEFNAIDHNYAVTIHASQGQGKDHVYHLYNQGMADNQSLLVGFTRSKVQYQIYGQADELEAARLRAGLDRKKENALAPQSRDLARVVKEARRVCSQTR